MASGGQNKISPRKFSEKIALLNKKEAEGNAEFEEIIKEVQATRTGQYTSGPGNISVARRTNDASELDKERERDELEEVYENLIKCVGQYEDEIQDSQHQQHQQQQQQHQEQQQRQLSATNQFMIEDSLGSSIGSAADLGCSSIAQVQIPINRSNSNHNQRFVGVEHQQQQRPLQCIDDINLANSTTPMTTDFGAHHNFSIIKSNHFSGSTSTIETNNSFYTQKAAPLEGNHQTVSSSSSGSSRARVTSFGSASSRYITTNVSPYIHHHQQSTYHPEGDQDGRATVCGGSIGASGAIGIGGNNSISYMGADQTGAMYLKPAIYDKAWHKSCSDPTLHAPCNSTTNIDGTISCSENHLPIQSTSANAPVGGLAQVASAAAAAASELRQRQRQHQVVSEQTRHYIEQTREQSQVIIPLAVDDAEKLSTNYVAVDTGVEEVLESISSLEEDKQKKCCQQRQAVPIAGDNSICDSNIMPTGDLPGIQICTIEDENPPIQSSSNLGNQCRQQAAATATTAVTATTAPVSQSTRPESRESSLPDIANLQFNVAGENCTNSSSGNQQNHPSILDNNHRQRALQNESTSSHSFQQISRAGPPASLSNSCKQLEEFGQNQQPVSAPISAQMSASSHNNNSSWNRTDNGTNGPLHAPRSNNYMSNSDCGLTSGGGTTATYHHLPTHLNDGILQAPPNSTCASAGGGGTSIFRSHSHNSIDYLTKQQSNHQYQYQQQQQYHMQQHQHQQPQQQQHQHLQQQYSNQHYQQQFAQAPLGYSISQPNSQQQLATHHLYAERHQVGALSCNRIAASVVQQSCSQTISNHLGGSMSPLDSPSPNLNSPQTSEQNSPGGSSTTTGDYGDYLPFQSAAAVTNSSAQSCPGQAHFCRLQQQQQSQVSPNNLGVMSVEQQTPSSVHSSSSHNSNQQVAYGADGAIVGQYQSQQWQMPQQQHQQQRTLFQQQQFCGTGGEQPPATSELSGSIGPCPSPSSARRLHHHNQATLARGTHSPFTVPRNPSVATATAIGSSNQHNGKQQQQTGGA